MAGRKRVQVLVSYSHLSSGLAKRFFAEFRQQALVSKLYDYSLWSLWHDRSKTVGERWRQALEEALEASNLVLLLVSPAFLASPFVEEVELPALLGSESKVVITVMLQPVHFDEQHSGGLERYRVFTLQDDRFRTPKAYAQCITSAQRERFVEALFEEVEERLDGLFAARQRSDRTANLPSIVQRDNLAEVRVFYATDRKRIGNRFTGDRGPTLQFGQLAVSIPVDHRMGQLEKPRIWRFEFREDPEKHVVLLELKELSRADFVLQARSTLADSPSAEALVFIHGFNVSFEDAARRTAQIAYDLNFQGVPFLYSWPSECTVGRYTVDEGNIQWTRPHLREFLALARTGLGANTVHVIAHSMGNRALAEVLADRAMAAMPEGAAHLRQIIFTAPDIDADTFLQLAALFRGRAERFTLYASDNDKALKASKKVHKYPRAGSAGPDLVVTGGVDTIDASDVETDLLGHSYYGANVSVISDMFNLIKHGHGPDERPRLRPREKAGTRYWWFQRA